VVAFGDPAFEDLTARARIRDAAMRLFAERGIQATTVRDIAAEAGVSAGLVRHHFGSKDDLRAACDAHVLARLVELKEQAVVEGRMAGTGFITDTQPTLLLLLRYLARSTLDGSPAADAMFEQMVELAVRWLAENHPGELSDPRAFAALLVAMEIGGLMMREQLSRALGADVLAPEGHLRLVRAKLDFYSKPLLDPALAAGALAALDRHRRESGPTGAGQGTGR
jgi:TetR/AcrR family transcriptional regulator, regulator of cefoperazone and chloramphenicol sensitivity